MSIAVLNQVYDETRRLAIAGSNLASGDFRLKKLAAPLQKSAAKAPVLGQVATLIEQLVDAPQKQSAQALLDLSSLVSAILYTQGQTAVDGKLTAIESSELGTQTTQVSAKLMKPLIEALTTTGSGRLEIVRESFERGAFTDLRIIDLAVGALDDVYPELADFVADNALPSYGKAILPLIQDKIDIKGRAGNVRRLRALYRLDPEAARPIVLDAFENGSKEMKIAALGCLGDSKQDLPHLQEQAKAKAKDVRRVALERLTAFNDAETIALYTKALGSADVDIVVRPISESKNPKLLALTHKAVESQISELLEGKAKTKLGKPLGRLSTLLGALESKSDKKTVRLLQSLFDQREAILKLKGTPTSGSDVVEHLTSVMLHSNVTSLQQGLVDARDEFGEIVFGRAVSVGVLLLTPAKFYDVFSPYYVVDKKAKGKAKERHEALTSVVVQRYGQHRWYYYGYHGYGGSEKLYEALAKAKWDPRWLDAAIKRNDLDGVLAFATKKDKALHTYLEKALAGLLKKSNAHTHLIDDVLAAMIRTDHARVTELFIDAVQKLAKRDRGYGMYYITRLVPDLPKKAVPAIEKILPSLPDRVVDEILEQLTALKAKKK